MVSLVNSESRCLKSILRLPPASVHEESISMAKEILAFDDAYSFGDIIEFEAVVNLFQSTDDEINAVLGDAARAVPQLNIGARILVRNGYDFNLGLLATSYLTKPMIKNTEDIESYDSGSFREVYREDVFALPLSYYRERPFIEPHMDILKISNLQ